MLIVDKKDALDIVSGTLPVVRGGTGVTTSTGTGNNVLSTSPTLVTPNIGVATGTSFNSITGLSSVVGTTSGTAAVGTSTTVARADHVHPIQTTITGNSSTTTALQTARTLTIGSTGKTFDGTANVSWSVAEIGAQPVDADLTAISALAGTSGLLKKTAADTWTLDTSAYVTSSGVTSVTGTAPIVSSGGNTPAISINAATTSAAGSMSATDKTKLDGIATNANNYVKPVNEPISYITGLQTELDSKATTTALNTEKGRIDAILSASTASTDTFAEIVTLINSVDTTNDAAFAGYVTSNNARSTTIETTLGNKVDKVAGKQLSTEDYTTIEKSKLSGIAAGAQVNVATDLSLGTATATTIPLNSSTGTDVTLPAVTTTTAGLMTSVDKTKLDGIATGANNYTHPTSGATAGTYKSVTVDANGHITAGSNPTTIAGYGITDATPSSHVGSTGIAHGNATTVVAGFMSNTDKTKLDSIAASANNYVLPTATASVLGGVKISATAQTVAANAVTATAAKTYAVQLDASGNAVVNVPWVDTDTNTIYTHPTSDGSLHVPATSTTNNGKVLMAGATAGSFSWQAIPLGVTDHTLLTNIGTNTHAQIDTALTRLANTSGTNTGDQTTITGNAGTATKLATARTINEVAFDGTSNITITDNTKLTKTNPSITGSVTEQVYDLTGTEINPANGTIQYKTISSDTTFTETLTTGQSVLLRLINASSYIITFPTITWVGAAAPVLTANCVIVLWKEQTTLYGAYVGSLV